MNHKMVIKTVGRLLTVEACLLVLPLIVSVIYHEACFSALLITILIAAAVGVPLMLLCKPQDKVIYSREGFVITALSWIFLSAVGALPFFISKEIPSYVDAFFETVSGFTTTGASILDNVEAISHGLQFWRCFTHWVGGMGVLVFLRAMTKNISDRSIHIMRAEMPGPIVDKITPRTKDTAKVLYMIYFALTFLEMIFLLFGGLPLFDSMLYAFGTAGTGGFGLRGDSIASYSPYIQWVLGIFMMLFGINFNLYYLAILKKFRTALKSSELWTYFGIILTATTVISINIHELYGNLPEVIRTAFFQVASLMTTTGFSTADFDAWPLLSKMTLLLLMFIGGCAGSTAGGLKVSRVMMYFKTIRRELKQLTNPRSVNKVRLEGKSVDENIIRGQSAYLAVYAVCFFIVFFLLGFDKFDIETNFTATAACFNNIGPGLKYAGPTESFSAFSDVSKLVLSAAMLLGRLEIFPILLTFVPSTWKKRNH